MACRSLVMVFNILPLNYERRTSCLELPVVSARDIGTDM